MPEYPFLRSIPTYFVSVDDTVSGILFYCIFCLFLIYKNKIDFRTWILYPVDYQILLYFEVFYVDKHIISK